MTYEKIFNYLSALEKNNQQEWFQQTKDQRKTAVTEFYQLVDELSLALHEKDSEIQFIHASAMIKHPIIQCFVLILDQRENYRSQ